MIAPFKKCNISKKVVTWGMILDTFILIDQTGTCLYSCDVQITSQHSVTWSYLSAKIKRSHRTEIIVSLLIEKTHDMATNKVILSTGTSWIWSFPATPLKGAIILKRRSLICLHHLSTIAPIHIGTHILSTRKMKIAPFLKTAPFGAFFKKGTEKRLHLFWRMHLFVQSWKKVLSWEIV